MLYLSDNCGNYPTFTPVVPISEFGKVAGDAIASLKKAPKVG